MKTFEERYTAWIDGQLTGPELGSFEKELDDRQTAEADKLDAHRLGGLLRAYGTAPALPNPDFFNHQLMARITAEQPKETTHTGGGRWFFSWPFLRLASVGVAAAVLGWGMARTIIHDVPTAPHQPAYYAQIIETRTADPNISATVLHSEQDNITVLWLDGMDYLPASYALQ